MTEFQPYPPITAQQQAMVKQVRDTAAPLINLLHLIGQTSPGTDLMGNRNLDFAEFLVQSGVMWAVKHLTSVEQESL